mmetsp:Transcript_34438/g.40274  ORF Transcript_34438/g.40274 Transcript_34438/m.40274 type:complete len:105 (-) Transcript_34438:206-520(-)
MGHPRGSVQSGSASAEDPRPGPEDRSDDHVRRHGQGAPLSASVGVLAQRARQEYGDYARAASEVRLGEDVCVCRQCEDIRHVLRIGAAEFLLDAVEAQAASCAC